MMSDNKRHSSVKRYICAAAVIGLILPGCSRTAEQAKPANTDDKAALVREDEFGVEIKLKDEYILVAEDGKLEMYVNGKTNQVKVVDTQSGSEWINFPDNQAGENNSAVTVEFINDSGSKALYNTYSDAMAYGQYSYCRIENGIRASYQLGEKKVARLAPYAISKERMEKSILAYLDTIDQTVIRTYYTLISLKDIENEMDRAVLEQRFPLLKKTDVYILGKSAADSESISDMVLESVESIIKKTPYTFDDLNQDHKENSIKTSNSADNTIQLSIEYFLQDGDLIVNIPNSGLVYDKKGIYITDLAVLPFFEAADSSAQGYSLIPDGSGALIYFNNKKHKYEPYKKYVYGRDKTDVAKELKSETMPEIYLPVFGMKTNEKGFLAIIEKGDAVASINSAVAGKKSNYNQTYASFRLTTVTAMDYTVVNAAANSYQREPYSEDITIRYRLLTGDSGYVDMAASYRSYLEQRLKKNSDDQAYHIGLEFVGGVTVVEPFFGYPKETVFPLTSYGNVMEILNELKQRGVENSLVKYLYWANGGIENTSAFNVDTIKQLGGRKEFNNLIRFITENQYTFYPVIEFNYVSKTGLFDKFNKSQMSARKTTDEIAYHYEYNIATLKIEDDKKQFIVSAKTYPEMFKSFLKDYKKFNLFNIGISSMGKDINSDFKQTAVLDRENSKNIISGELDKLVGSGYRLSFSGGNSYVLPFASSITEIPLNTSMNYLFDKEVPFYQIALGGLIPTCSQPLNLSSDYKKDVLKCIETGTRPYFRLMYQQNGELKETEYNFFGLHYKDWVEDISEIYKIFSNELKPTENQKIISHQEISENVFQTVFENGISVYVNYSGKKYDNGAVAVEPESFAVKPN